MTLEAQFHHSDKTVSHYEPLLRNLYDIREEAIETIRHFKYKRGYIQEID